MAANDLLFGDTSQLKCTSIYIEAGTLAMMFMLTQGPALQLESYSMKQGFVTNMTQLHFVTRSPTLFQFVSFLVLF